MHHTQAIVLRKDEWREADLLVTLLTSDFGKIRALAQGARKHGAKLQGHLEPGTTIAASIVSGKNGYRLTTARAHDLFLGIRQSLVRMEALYLLLGMLDRSLFEEREGAGNLYSLATQAVSALNGAGRRETARMILAWFYVRLWKQLGILPHSESKEARSAELLFKIGECSLETLFGFEPRAGEIERQIERLNSFISEVPVLVRRNTL